MGAWGELAFDNDTACDWAYELADASDLRLVEAAFADVEAVGSGYLDQDVACVALAACEVVARLQGHPGYTNSYTEKSTSGSPSIRCRYLRRSSTGARKLSIVSSVTTRSYGNCGRSRVRLSGWWRSPTSVHGWGDLSELGRQSPGAFAPPVTHRAQPLLTAGLGSAPKASRADSGF
jgi:Domain of unknown function (DUF4259)